MQRPHDIENYNQCVKVLPERTIIFCVECDKWHSVEMSANARVEFVHTGIRETELDEESIQLYCTICGADIDYLLNDHRNEVIRQLHHAPVAKR